jgi:site-specific recombinase XerC
VSTDRLLLCDAAEVALHELAGVYAANERTSVKVLGEVRRFVRYANACGVEYLHELTGAHVEGYVWAAARHRGRMTEVSPRTAANRQGFVRRFMDVLGVLGLWSGGDIVGAPIDRGASERCRALTADEMRLVEVYAGEGLFVSRRPLMVAFAQAGADAGEIASVTASDMDVSAGTVVLGADQNRRINPLTRWGAGIVAEHLAAAKTDEGQPLCVAGGKPAHRAAHAVTVGLRETLVAAGIAGRRGVTARSIALASAQQVLGRDGIVAAARFLGSNSLDSTAASLDFDWQAR